MTELVRSIAAGALWALAFAVFAMHASRAPFGVTDEGSPIERSGRGGFTRAGVLIAYPAFTAFQVVLAKLLAALGLLRPWAVLVAYAAVVALGLAAYWRRGRRDNVPTTPVSDAEAPERDSDAVLVRNVVLGGAALVVAGLAIFSLVVPLTVWDVLAYHMPMVASYIQHGSLDAWPTQDLRQIYRVNAGELQLLNIALLSGSEAWVELINALGLVVCLVAAYELGWLAFARRSLAWLVVALMLTAPQILFGAASAKNDLVFTAVLLGAFVWAIRAARSDSRAATYAVLAAVCGGVAAATKVMGLNVLGAVGVAPNEVTYRWGFGNLVAAAHYYVYDLTFKRLLIAQIFEHDFAHYGYFFPFLAAGAVVAGIRLAVKRGVRTTPGAGLALMAVALFLSVIAVRLPIQWDQRFMIWLVPTFAILATSLVAERLDGRRVLALATAATAVAVMNVVLIFSNGAEGVFARSATYFATTGQLARDVDVPSERYGGMIEGFSELERAAATDSVLYIGSDDWWMYPSWGRGFTRHVRGVWNAADAAEQIAARRHRFVVIEATAATGIRDSATAAARRSGYTPVFSSDRREILERSAPPLNSAAPPQAALRLITREPSAPVRVDVSPAPPTYP